MKKPFIMLATVIMSLPLFSSCGENKVIESGYWTRVKNPNHSLTIYIDGLKIYEYSTVYFDTISYTIYPNKAIIDAYYSGGETHYQYNGDISWATYYKIETD